MELIELSGEYKQVLSKGANGFTDLKNAYRIGLYVR